MNKLQNILLITLTLALFSSCNINQNAKVQISGEAQGTYYVVTYFAPDTLVSKRQIDSLLTAFDLSASTWVPESIITKFNENREVKYDKYFTDILKQSKRVCAETQGAFDITVGPLVNAWGFGFKNKIPVDEHIVDSLLKLVDFGSIKLEGDRIIKSNPDIQIDYNAIAQGYSVDVLSGFLQSRGIDNHLIDIGGEVYAKGNKPNGKLWVVGIEKPAENAEAARTLDNSLKIKNQAVATSGSYRKFYEEDGIKYSHTIDPKTGYPVRHSLLSATVVTDSTSLADAYATALMVMGPEAAKKFLGERPDIEAYLIYSLPDGSYETWATEKMRNRLQMNHD